MSPPKHACVNCHFFMKTSPSPSGTTNPVRMPISSEYREKAHAGDYSWVLDHDVLGCGLLVWDESFESDKRERHHTIVEQDRRKFCFFWKNRPGMLFPAAEVLQKREAEAHEARRDRRLTGIGLLIAALALLINAILAICQR